MIDEINGERIDIVRWNDSMQVMIPNALQPAEIMDVQLYPRLGRAIVLVAEDQLSLAIGRRGQNVRLASKLVGWDIDIMTMEELSRDLDKAERWFNRIPGMQPEYIEALITEGFFSYTDLTFLEAEQLSEIIGIDPEAADEIDHLRRGRGGADRAGGRAAEMQDAAGRSRLRPKASRPRGRGAVSDEAAAIGRRARSRPRRSASNRRRRRAGSKACSSRRARPRPVEVPAEAAEEPARARRKLCREFEPRPNKLNNRAQVRLTVSQMPDKIG